MKTKLFIARRAFIRLRSSFIARSAFILLMAFAGLFAAATFGACSKDENSNSPLVGTWQSVGYYDNSVNGNYYPGITTAPIPDISEKITFKSKIKHNIFIKKFKLSA